MAKYDVILTVDMVIEADDTFKAEEKALEAIALAKEQCDTVVRLITVADTVRPYKMRNAVPQ